MTFVWNEKEKTAGGKMLQQVHVPNKKICPFVQNPSDNCHCYKMGSQDIEKAIYYCNKNYSSCDIYNSRYFKHPGSYMMAGESLPS